jgi:ABC-type lipoprotein export system ATPase subunit
VLNDKSISRRHATLQPLPNGGCLVRDEHSQGGSFVNGRRFDEHEFTVGDRLEIGPFCFQFDGLALVRVANTSGGSIRAGNILMQVSERSLIGMLTGRGRMTNVILDDVSVTIPPSRFFGLIGPSGAGKSSLLHTIAGLRKPEGGTVLIDGEDIYAHDVPPSFGFVPQDDIVHPELTVRQALQFSARLRLARETPRHELDRLIAQTMEQLLLTPRAALPIWRLSGGQRKRVSVAVELLARPSILFLDEPSSGLDPATEFQLMT